MSAPPPARRRAPRFCAGLAAAAALLVSVVAAGRSPVVDPVPWDELHRDPGLNFSVQRYDDSDTGWSADRIGLRVTRRAGESSLLFLHFDYVSLRAGDPSVLERWPELAGPEAGDGWPGESRVSGWVRPGFGLMGRIAPPLIGDSRFVLGLDLPLGKDSLYPFGGRAMPLRLHLLRPVDLGRGLALELGAGQIVHVDSPGDELASDAFGSAAVLEGGLTWRGGGRSLGLRLESLSGDGVSSRVLSLSGSIPSGENGRFDVGLACDLGDESDRVWETRFTMGWTFSMPQVQEQPPTGEMAPDPLENHRGNRR